MKSLIAKMAQRKIIVDPTLVVAAGFTPTEALASATIQTARLVGADARTGSIVVGKPAFVD
jgi:imidazolonepropionase-like amidohydrolase